MTPLESRVLKTLNEIPLTAIGISKQCKCTPESAHRVLKKFVNEKLVKKEGKLWVAVDAVIDISPPTVATNHEPLDQSLFIKYFEYWAEHGWNPSMFKSSYDFPRVVTELYEMALSVRNGEKLDKTNFAELQLRLSTTLKDLDKVSNLIKEIKATEELWTEQTLADFLLEDDDSSYYEHLIEKVKSNGDIYS